MISRYLSILSVTLQLSALAVTALKFSLEGNNTSEAIVVLGDAFLNTQVNAFASCYNATQQKRAFQAETSLQSDTFGTPACDALFRSASASSMSSRAFWLPTNGSYFEESFFPLGNGLVDLWSSQLHATVMAPNSPSWFNLTIQGPVDPMQQLNVYAIALNNQFIPFPCTLSKVQVIENGTVKSTLSGKSCGVALPPSSTSEVVVFLAANSVASSTSSVRVSTNGRIVSSNTQKIAQNLPYAMYPLEATVWEGSTTSFSFYDLRTLANVSSGELALKVTTQPQYGNVTLSNGNATDGLLPFDAEFLYLPNPDIRWAGERKDSVSVTIVERATGKPTEFGARVVVRVFGIDQPPILRQNITVDVPVSVVFQNETNYANGWISDQNIINPDFRIPNTPLLTEALQTLQVQGQLESDDFDSLGTRVYSSMNVNGKPFLSNVTIYDNTNGSRTESCKPVLLNGTSSMSDVLDAWNSLGDNSASMLGCGLANITVTPEGQFTVLLPKYFGMPVSASSNSTDVIIRSLQESLQPIRLTFFVQVADAVLGTGSQGTGTVEVTVIPTFPGLPNTNNGGAQSSPEESNSNIIPIIIASVGLGIIAIAAIIGFIMMAGSKKHTKSHSEAGSDDSMFRGMKSSGTAVRHQTIDVAPFDETASERTIDQQVRGPSPLFPGYIDNLPGEKWNPLYRGNTPEHDLRTSSVIGAPPQGLSLATAGEMLSSPTLESSPTFPTSPMPSIEVREVGSGKTVLVEGRGLSRHSSIRLNSDSYDVSE